MLEGCMADAFVPKSAAPNKQYPTYYSKYFAGYVGPGCDGTTCGGTTTTKTDLEIAMVSERAAVFIACHTS